MSPSASRSRPAALAATLAFASLLSCGREVTGPGGAGRQVEIQFNPVFETVRLGGDGRVLSIGDVVAFTRVRVVLLRANGDTAVDRLVEFPPDSTSVRLAVNVTLSQAATSEGEPMQATLKYINTTGDTVFTGGPAAVVATSGGGANTPPPSIPVRYTGNGANAASLVIAPPSFIGTINQQASFAATVRDSGNATMSAVPVAFTSTDSNLVRVDLRTGQALLAGARGTARVIAQTLTGQADTAAVTITPTASAIVLVSGGAQSVRQGEAFALPVRVRVNAVDDLPIAGVPVAFAVTRGQGSALPTIDTTDASGLAEATWTAGDSAGVGNLTATVIGRPLSVVATGNQLSSSPTALTFGTQPANLIAGDTIAPLVVVVRDATADTVTGFTGVVSLDLTGGAAGATIVGVASRAAVNGVATFPGLTIDRAGTAFRVRAVVTGVPPVLSNTFNVAAAPPRFVTVIGGAGQTAPPASVLADSVKVRVTNVFGQPVGAVPVTFAVALGGGTVAPATMNTDSLGVAATQWTLGVGGTQQITATVTGVQPAVVSAALFTGAGSPALFSGVEVVSVTVLSARSIPIFVSPAAGVPIVATLTMADTTIATWMQDSVVFTPGATLRTPAILGRAQGATMAYVTSAIGTDSIEVNVETAAIRMSGYYNTSVMVGDTLRKAVRLSAPAPAGGVTVNVVSTDAAILLVAPGSGRGAPAERCDDYYCSDEPMPGAPAGSILAPPADSTTVFIPAGETTAQLVILPIGAGVANVRLSAPSFATDDRNFDVQAAAISVFYYNSSAPLLSGSRAQFQVSTARALTRDVRVRLTSRDTEVLSVDSIVTIDAYENAVYDLRVRGTGAGTTWIVAEAQGFAPDSFDVTVVQPQLFVTVRTPVTAVGQRYTAQFTAATDSLGSSFGYGDWLTGVSVSATSSDTSVLRVEFGGRIRPSESYGSTIIRGVAPGTAWLRISASGFRTDSVLVTVSNLTIGVSDPDFRVGVGQIHQSMYVFLATGSGYDADDPVTVNVSSSDASRVEVLSPTLVSDQSGGFPSPRFLANATGTVTLTFAGPLTDTVSQTFQVVPPRAMLTGGALSSGGTFDADSSLYGILGYTADDFGYLRAVGDGVVGVLRSTDPAVVAVVDSIVTVAPGSYVFNGGSARAIAPGTARLILTAPGYVPDTTPLITLRPFRLVVQDSIGTGVGLRSTMQFARRSPSGSALPFTLTVNGPADVSPLSPTGTIPAGSVNGSFVLRAGLVTGVDTVIVAAAGHVSDTLLVSVGPSKARPSLAPQGPVGAEGEVSVFLDRIGGFNAIAPQDTVLLVLTSRDSSIVRIIDDTVRLAPDFSGSPYVRGVVRFLRPGLTRIIATDPSGRFAPDSQSVQAVRRSLYANPNRLDIGMASQTYPTELYLYRQYAEDDSVWVQLRSSAPGIARAVQDSVLFVPGSNFAYYDVAAGDTVGGAIITASAPGFVDMPIDVGVSRTSFVTSMAGNVREGRNASFDMYLVSGRYYYTRQSTVDLPVRLRSEDPAVASIGADSLGTIVAGTGYLEGVLGPVQGAAVGRTRIVVEDDRVGDFRRATPGTRDVEVRRAAIRSQEPLYSVGIGMRGQDPFFDLGGGDEVGVWVRFTSVTGRVAFPSDSVFVPPFSSGAYYQTIGLSAGIDTVVLSATGFASDTVIANVTAGRLFEGNMPASIDPGDSVLVTLYFLDPRGQQATIAPTPRTLTFSTTGGMQVLPASGPGPLTSLLVPVGAQEITFWVRSTGSGGGEVIITSPGMIELRARIVSPLAGN